MTSPALDPPEITEFVGAPVDDDVAHVAAVVDGFPMHGVVPRRLLDDPAAAVALLIDQAREQARQRAAGQRQPLHLPPVPPCTGCGSKVNPMTGECAGCSD